MAMSASGSLTALLRQSTLLDHEDVLKAANAVLKKSKNDWDAQHVKAVALLKLDRYEDAVKFLDDVEEDTKNKLVLEKAYALYKLGKWEEAENLACRGSSKRALKHVEAQAVFTCSADVRRSGPDALWSIGIPSTEIPESGGTI